MKRRLITIGATLAFLFMALAERGLVRAYGNFIFYHGETNVPEKAEQNKFSVFFVPLW